MENLPRPQWKIIPKIWNMCFRNLPGGTRIPGTMGGPYPAFIHNPDIVYHGVQYVMKSTDQGETWKKISPDLTYNDPKKQGDISYQTISAMDESAFNPDLIYAGTDDGRLWRTKNGGEILGRYPDRTHCLSGGFPGL